MYMQVAYSNCPQENTARLSPVVGHVKKLKTRYDVILYAYILYINSTWTNCAFARPQSTKQHAALLPVVRLGSESCAVQDGAPDYSPQHIAGIDATEDGDGPLLPLAIPVEGDGHGTQPRAQEAS